MSFWNYMSEPSTTSLEPRWQKSARYELTQAAKPAALERIERAGQGYSGDMTAGISSAEQTGQNLLADYLGSPSYTQNGLYTSAQDELSKTLGGSTYDPAGGEYYQAFRTAVLRELGESKDRLGSTLSASDAYFGGGRTKETGNLEEGAMTQLAQTLGQLALQERQNRLNAVPMAASMAKDADAEAISKIAMAQQYGSLPRQLEQAENDARYQEWLRQLSDLGLPLDVYSAMITYQPPMAIGPSVSSQVAEGINSAANLISSIKGTGGTNPGTSAGPVTKSSGSSGNMFSSYGRY